MIYWKVKVGTIPINTDLTSVSQINFLDSDSIFPIYESRDLTTIASGIKSTDTSNVYNVIKEWFGSQVDLFYGVPGCKGPYDKLNADSLSYLEFGLPSISKNMRNTFDYLTKTPSGTVIYFITLNKMLVKGLGGGSSGWNLYTVSGDSIIQKLKIPYEFPGIGYGLTISQNNVIEFGALCIDQYIDATSLLDTSKYSTFKANIWINTSENLQNLLFEKGSCGEGGSATLGANLVYLLGDSPSPPDGVINIPDNPYDPIDPSGPGGGGGAFDDSSDLIPDSSLPTLSSANTGFTRIYNPTLSQVQDLAQYLWTDETLIQTLWNKIKQYFEDPMQAIIGFNLVPVPVPDAGTKNFALMYIDTGVSMNVAASQFVDRDCGTLKIEPYFGSALDYAPHTKISIFLPFIGTVQLNTDEVMNRTLQVKYRVDICSGSCVAKVAVDGNFIYQFSGHCAIPIPISSADFSSYVGAAISVAKLGITAAVGAATGGAGLLAAGAAQQTGNAITTTTETVTARNPETGRQITTGTRTVETSKPVQSTGASFSGLSPANISNTVGEIMASKPFVEHSGSFSGNTGYLGVRRPFVIIERPNLCLPENFQNYNGYPAMITMNLSECTGYTQIQQIQLTGVPATNPEQAEIMELLKEGVIF